MPAVAAVVSLDDVERSRRESVLAYCARLCDPDRIAEAVEAAFAGLHDQLETADGHAAVDLDRILLDETRAAAAARTDASAGLPGFAGLSLRRSSACEVMPKLLAARASELLGDSDLERVDKHLSRCAACRELESRRREAERAFTLLRAAPPADGSVEPFASPGDEALDIEAALAAARAVPEASEAATPVEPPNGNGFGPAGPGSSDDTREHAVLPPVGVDEPGGVEAEPVAAYESLDEPSTETDETLIAPPEPVAADEPATAAHDDPATAAHEPSGTTEPTPSPPAPTAPALRDDITGEYAFELAEPEPADTDRAEPEAPAPAVAAAAHGDHEPTSRSPRPTWMKWATVVGPLAVAAVAIGLIAALGGGDDESNTGGTRGPTLTPQEQAAASRPTAPAPAAERPTRTERRLDALGDRLLSPGMKGDDVKTLQRLLGVPQTGTYDALTQYAVGEFQAQQDLPVDGQAGTQTKRLLARRPRPPENPPTLPADGSTLPGDQATPEDEVPDAPGSDAQAPGTTDPSTGTSQQPDTQQPPATGTQQPPATGTTQPPAGTTP